MLTSYAELALQDPNTDRTYLLRKIGKQIIPKDEVERVIPLSVDEHQAREENKQLADNEMPRVIISQDHNAHLRVHAAAPDNEATRRHVQLHIYMLMQKRMNPAVFPQLPSDQPLLDGQNPSQQTLPAKTSAPPEGAGAGAPMMQ
jgi:hypothetical protein